MSYTEIKKITDAERNNVCITGLPDTPGLSTREMQQRFDGLGNLAIDKLNQTIGVLNDIVEDLNVADIGNLEQRMNDLEQAVVSLTNKISNMIQSVDNLPQNPSDDTLYIVQGEVVIE